MTSLSTSSNPKAQVKQPRSPKKVTDDPGLFNTQLKVVEQAKLEVATLSLLCEARYTPLSDAIKGICNEFLNQLADGVPSKSIVNVIAGIESLKKDFHPSNYITLPDDDFHHDYLCISFLKYSTCSLIGGLTKKELSDNAFAAFWANERKLKESSTLFLNNIADPVFRDSLYKCRYMLVKILGKLTPSKLTKMVNATRFGPGSTTSCSMVGGIPSKKFGFDFQLTETLIPYIEALIGPTWRRECITSIRNCEKRLDHEHGLALKLNEMITWIGPRINTLTGNCIVRYVEEKYYWSVFLAKVSATQVVPGNRFTSVPKTAVVNRPICIEPDLNVWAQLGVGKLIRDGLKNATGIDLSEAQIEHGYLVQDAISRRLATIDLKGASDAILTSVIEYIFRGPVLRPWFELMKIVRSSRTVFTTDVTTFDTLSKEFPDCKIEKTDGNEVTFSYESEKFANMGNGFTFELETALFYAISWSVLQKNDEGLPSCLKVYGDDIIVPQSESSEVCNALNAYGFSINWNKSYTSGLFFESCGVDFYANQLTRPFFTRPRDLTRDLHPALYLANGLRHYCHRRNHFVGCSNLYLKAYGLLVKQIPKAQRVAIPNGFGDVGLITSLREVAIIESYDDAKRQKTFEKMLKASHDAARYYTTVTPMNKPAGCIRHAPDGLEGYVFDFLKRVYPKQINERSSLLLYFLHRGSTTKSIVRTNLHKHSQEAYIQYSKLESIAGSNEQTVTSVPFENVVIATGLTHVWDDSTYWTEPS